MTDTYINEGDMLIQSPFSTALPPSIIHATNSRGEYVECDRRYWRNEWRVVDAQPGTMWPTKGPKGKA